MAKSNLKPSTLALRKGETDESTKGTRTRYLYSSFQICFHVTAFFTKNSWLQAESNRRFIIDNSSGTFISASEDKTGILDAIEQKIARATMLPKTHGEVGFLMNILILKLGTTSGMVITQKCCTGS